MLRLSVGCFGVGSVALLGTLLFGRVATATVIDTITFSEAPYGTATSGVTAMAWAPDASQRLFLTVKDGPVRIMEDGVLRAEPFATLTPVYTSSECGVLGVAFDPAFSNNRYVYFFVTTTSDTQQIIRYTDNGETGEDRTVIVADLPTNGANHDGGALGFGPDGKLYWAIGDLGNGTGVDADLASMAAKIGRVNRDGTAAADNPFGDGAGPNDERIWARGFRNPFTLSFQPSTERLWVNTVGTGYEQVFRPRAADHAGYNDFENNQPDGYLSPVIAYRTNGADEETITSAVRSGGVAWFTSSSPSRFRVGGSVTVAGVSDASFNGTGHVTAVAGDQFSLAQGGADATSSGGTATSEAIGGCITGGTFWDSSAPPAAFRGNFFFGDYNSSRVERVTLATNNDIATVEHFATSISQVVDMSVGPDGNLYYAGIGGSIWRTSYNATAQGLVVSALHRRGQEGASVFFHVRLARAPAADVSVSVTRASGDSNVAVTSGGELTFTAADWQTPQPVEISLGEDSDTSDDSATVRVLSTGLRTENVLVRVTDTGSFDEPGSGGAGGAGEGGAPSSGGSAQGGDAAAGEDAGGEAGGGGSGGADDRAGAGGEAGADGGEDGTGGARPPAGGASGRAGASGNAGSAGSGSAPAPATDDGGCGCRTPSGRSEQAAFPLVFALLAGAGLRRRRKV